MKSSTTVAWIGLLVGVTVVGALASYVQSQPDLNGHPGKTAHEIQKARGTTPHNTKSVLVLSPRYENGDSDLVFDSQTTDVPDGEDKHVFVVNTYLKTAGVSPADAKLVRVIIQDRVATLEFNEAFNTTYGTDDERTLVNGILKTLGQFPEIEKAIFTIEGKPLETLGNIDLTEAQDVLR